MARTQFPLAAGNGADQSIAFGVDIQLTGGAWRRASARPLPESAARPGRFGFFQPAVAADLGDGEQCVVDVAVPQQFPVVRLSKRFGRIGFSDLLKKTINFVVA